MKTFVSDISGKRFPVNEKIPASAVRASVLNVIRIDHPDFDHTKSLSVSELNQYREKYISKYLAKEVGQLSKLDRKVLKSIKERTVITDDADDTSKYTIGERIADRVAGFGGSWPFIIIFGLFLLVWITANVVMLSSDAFDPYPFILLNLLLSCLAAIQAPIIMMSQNRQAAKDREHSNADYMVNLKSELEIRALHEKMDHLMIYQQQELIEAQKIQIDMLTDIIDRMDKKYESGAQKKDGESKKRHPEKQDG